jgi:hypothetical protein
MDAPGAGQDIDQMRVQAEMFDENERRQVSPAADVKSKSVPSDGDPRKQRDIQAFQLDIALIMLLQNLDSATAKAGSQTLGKIIEAGGSGHQE